MSTKVTVGTRDGKVVLIATDGEESLGLEFGPEEATEVSEALLNAVLSLAHQARREAGEVPS